jgi:hypothetical protein
VDDGSAERGRRGALGVDVDPLVVAGRLRERVDVGLGDLAPVRHAELATLGGAQSVEPGERGHGRAH